MRQINLQSTRELESDLKICMKLTGITHRSEAIRKAVHEMAERVRKRGAVADFYSWIGLALEPGKVSRPSQRDEDALWD